MDSSTANAAETATNKAVATLNDVQRTSLSVGASLFAPQQQQQQTDPFGHTLMEQQSQKPNQTQQSPALAISQREEHKSDLLQKRLSTAIEENVNLQLELDAAAARELTLRKEIESLKSSHGETDPNYKDLNARYNQLQHEYQAYMEEVEKDTANRARDNTALYQIMQSIKQSSDSLASAVDKVKFVTSNPDDDQNTQLQTASTTPILIGSSSTQTNATTPPSSSQLVPHTASNSSLISFRHPLSQNPQPLQYSST